MFVGCPAGQAGLGAQGTAATIVGWGSNPGGSSPYSSPRGPPSNDTPHEGPPPCPDVSIGVHVDTSELKCVMGVSAC